MANRVLEIEQRLKQKYDNGNRRTVGIGFSRHVRAFSDQNFDVRFPVPLVPQQTGMSCWAAGAAMIVAWRENYSVDPAQIAHATGEWASYSAGLQPESTTIFPLWGLTPEPQQSYSVEAFRRLLETYGPLWVAGAVPGSHIRVVTGMYGDGQPDSTMVLINDPWQKGMKVFSQPNAGAQYEQSYTQFVADTERLAREEAQVFPRAIYVARSTHPRRSSSQSRRASGFGRINGHRHSFPVVPNFQARTFSMPVDFDVARGVPAIKKTTPMTCWAAATAMLVSYKDGRNVPVEEAVRRAGSRYEQMLQSDTALTKVEATEYLSALGLSSMPTAEMNVEKIDQMLRRFGALWLTPDYEPAFSLDARIVTGVHGDGTPTGTSVSIIDPSSGREATVTFDHLKQVFEQEGISSPLGQFMTVHWQPDTLGTAVPQGVASQSSIYQRPRSLSHPLSDWASLISFRPSTTTQKAVKNRATMDVMPLAWFVQKIEDGRGDVNLDFYPVHISQLPTSGAGAHGEAALLAYIRQHMNDFVDTNICEFKPYAAADVPLWMGTSPLEAVVHIDMKVPVLGGAVNLDDGAVVVSEVAADHWIFSTIRTGGDGYHPVSGNRQFGFMPAPEGGFIFYTRGADRLTTFLEANAAGQAFTAADRLWKSFQTHLVNYVLGAGGSARILSPISVRHVWPADVSAIYSPTEAWI